MKGKVAMKKVIIIIIVILIIIIIVILNIRIVKKVLCWKLYKIIIFCQLWDMGILNHQFLIYSIAATCLYAIFEGIPTI